MKPRGRGCSTVHALELEFMSRSGALTGIRVIDFGRFIAGPYCGMLLADMGADVVRVDRRKGSEDRYTGPVTEQGEGGAFLSLNRNKRSITLDTSKRGIRGDHPAVWCAARMWWWRTCPSRF